MTEADRKAMARQSLRDADLRRELAEFVMTCSPSALSAIIGAAGWQNETQWPQER